MSRVQTGATPCTFQHVDHVHPKYGACSKSLLASSRTGVLNTKKKNLIGTQSQSTAQKKRTRVRPFAFSLALLNFWRACKNSIPSLGSNLERTIRTFIFLHPARSLESTRRCPRRLVRELASKGVGDSVTVTLHIRRYSYTVHQTTSRNHPFARCNEEIQ